MSLGAYNIVVGVEGEYPIEYGATPGVTYPIGTVLNIIDIDPAIAVYPLPLGLILQLNEVYTANYTVETVKNEVISEAVLEPHITPYGTVDLVG